MKRDRVASKLFKNKHFNLPASEECKEENLIFNLLKNLLINKKIVSNPLESFFFVWTTQLYFSKLRDCLMIF